MSQRDFEMETMTGSLTAFAHSSPGLRFFNLKQGTTFLEMGTQHSVSLSCELSNEYFLVLLCVPLF